MNWKQMSGMALLVFAGGTSPALAANISLMPYGAYSFGSDNSTNRFGLLEGVGSDFVDGTATSSTQIRTGGQLQFLFGMIGVRLGGFYAMSPAQSGSISFNGEQTHNVSSKWNGYGGSGDLMLFFAPARAKSLSGFYIGGGGEYNQVSFSQDWSAVADGAESGTVKGTGSGIGARGFAGYLIALGSSVGLALEGGYRYATISEFKADEDSTLSSGNPPRRIGAGQVIRQANIAENDWTGENVELDLGGPYFSANIAVHF